MAGIPTCIITGRIAGDRFACGDCDPCSMGREAVPKAVKELIAERDEWMEKYESAITAEDDYDPSRDM